MHSLLIALAEEINPLMPHTAEIIFGLLLLVLLWIVFAKVVVPRFEKAYATRHAEIEGGIEKAKQAQAEAQEALEKYNAQLAEARSEAATIREEARDEGAKILAEMRSQAQAESDRIVQHAHAQIEAERAQAVASLRRDVGSLAVELAGKVVGESLSDSDAQRRTVDRFLAELESSEPASVEGH